MNFYVQEENIIATDLNLSNSFKSSSKEEALNTRGKIFFLAEKNPKYFRRCFLMDSSSSLPYDKEDLNVLRTNSMLNSDYSYFNKLIEEKTVVFLNSAYNNWTDLLNKKQINRKWKVNVIGLGDVGGTLVTGLRLMGGDVLSSIGIYDKDESKVNRWYFESNAILDINFPDAPFVFPLEEKDLFNCDMFIFCVSVGVPKVGKEHKDVRLAQLEGNSKIVSYYAKLARKNNFKGVFSVVSDPVDLLCKVAFNESNKDDKDEFDFNGLGSDQIRGYGLGVMNGRAAFYAKEKDILKNYNEEGRAFGPHGEGLIIVNSVENYDENISNLLTDLTKKANLDVRKTGFKPYIAPALSSGSLSILATIRGQWHYSTNFLGGTFMGSKNKYGLYGAEFETYNFNETLFNKLKNTYDYLNSIYF
ncbi:lactate/malate family dehydrogenase [Clostridium amazonitimonense]|uniref:lactate/malate family dehydrogenase n=1 Tax=Clostridium amazonitimonense TaxID=1499689 RepID=UPI000509696D|nr:hypothetical protein [Clostridium amazonitimonense]